MADILLVEDDWNTRIGLSEILRDEGYEVEAASDATSALTIIESKTVDLLLSDLKLPDFSGLELYQRSKAVRPDLVAIIMSAYGTHDDRLHAEQLGVVSWLTKPIALNDLLMEISNALTPFEKSRSREEVCSYDETH